MRYNSLVTVTVGLDAARIPNYTAIYVPDPEVRFHRLSFPAVFSPHNAPAGQTVIQAEITTNPGDGTHEMSDEALLADVIGDLVDMDLARRSELCYSRVLRTKYGYVVQNDDCRRYLKQAKAYFEEIGIPLCGRVAEFEYINMDVCIERARKVAERISHVSAGYPACPSGSYCVAHAVLCARAARTHHVAANTASRTTMFSGVKAAESRKTRILGSDHCMRKP